MERRWRRALILIISLCVLLWFLWNNRSVLIYWKCGWCFLFSAEDVVTNHGGWGFALEYVILKKGQLLVSG